MKEKLIDIGGIILFYLMIVLGVLLLNSRFNYVNHLNISEKSETYIAMNE